MKLNYILTVCMAAAGISYATNAAATTFSYDHKYEDLSKTHTDELEVSHHFSMGLKASATLKFQPHEQDNGDSGLAFKDERWHETKLSVGYPITLAPEWIAEPGFSWSRKQDEYKYKPSLKVKYAFLPGANLSVRYRDEITDYSTKATKRDNRIDFGGSYKLGHTKLAYVYTYYHGNTNLYNHSRSNYKHEVEVDYKLTKKFSPFIEVKNESFSSKSDRRETEYVVGFDYKI